jgi:hypothetical protein
LGAIFKALCPPAGGIAAGSAAAVVGASGTACATATGLGAAAGGAAATAVTSTSAGGAALTAGIAAGPVGWICLGAATATNSASSYAATASTTTDEIKKYTFDCWKEVVHEESITPSNGMLIKDVILHPSIKAVHMAGGGSALYPELLIENVWDEKFQIQYVTLDNGVLAAHALRID